MREKILLQSLIVSGAILAGLVVYEGYDQSLLRHAMAATGPSSTGRTQSANPAILPDFTAIVAQNGPAVVNITVTNKATEFRGLPKMDPDDPAYQFFRRFGVPVPQGESPLHGVGSGFIVSPDGTILTNAHVVDGAVKVSVKLTDKREFNAKVVGVDEASDVAVLKVEASNLPVVQLDPADDVKVGEWVLAIGSPFGFDNSATSGIVSAKSRMLSDETFVPYIQTDVAVNPGNSGGPLFNLKGEVIGINSQIYSRTGGYQGLSFAIPISVALNVKNQLLEHGHVSRGHLGVMIQDVDQALADSFGLQKPMGALVSSVEPGSPAAKAGLKEGDVIIRYNEQNIANSSDLPVLIANMLPGTTAKLDVMRNGSARQVEIKVGEMKTSKVALADIARENHGRLGLVVRPLSPDEKKEASVKGGVVVEDVSGPAANAGIQPGDLILSINGTPVSSTEQLKGLMATAGKHVALLVQRADTKIFIPIDLG